jgi:hypothetical protein
MGGAAVEQGRQVERRSSSRGCQGGREHVRHLLAVLDHLTVQGEAAVGKQQVVLLHKQHMLVVVVAMMN